MRSLTAWTLAASCSLSSAACGAASPGPASSRDPAPPPPASSSEAPADEGPGPNSDTPGTPKPGPPRDPNFEVMQRVCAADCAGPFARVLVFRDEDGAVGRLRFDGDLERCSHPPRLFFDAEGNKTLAVAERPLSGDSQEAQSLAAQQLAQVEGLTKAETLRCPEADRCSPERMLEPRSSSACRTDSDCRICACAPVDVAEWAQRGGVQGCVVAGEECEATNPACCAGRCAAAR